MGCLIKIKTNDGYLYFNNRESAEEFISKKIQSGELEFLPFDEEFPNDEKTDTAPQEQTQNIIQINTRSKNGSVRKILELAGKRSKTLTKQIQDLMESEGLHAKGNWDTEEFNKKSNIIGCGQLLQQLRIDDKRLFPEFISKNYQNTLIIKEILKETKLYRNDDKSLDNQCSKIAELLEFSTEDRVLKPEEWIAKISSAVKESDQELFQVLQGFDSAVYNVIINNVKSTLQSNIIQLFKGEIFHVVFEEYSNQNPKNIKAAYQKIINKLKTRYAECDEIKEVFGSVDSLFTSLNDLFMSSNSFGKTLFDKYLHVAQQIHSDILQQFKDAYPGASIEVLKEQKITLKIDDSNIKNTCFGDKEYVQGKMDIVVLVNGVAHIIDLKTIKSQDALDFESVKFSKTKFTMGMYKRMLERTGIPVGNVYLYDISTIDDDISAGRLTRISNQVGDAYVQGVLDNVMKRINYPKTDIKVDPVRYIEHSNKLFGEQVSKSKKGFDVESLRERISLQEFRGKQQLAYTLINAKGKEEVKYYILKEGDNIEEKKSEIAEAMLANREKYESTRFKFIKDSLRDIINGSKDISSLYAYQASEYEARYWGATLLKYKNAKGIIEVDGLDDYGIILVETDSGVDVLCVTNAEIYSSWDSNNDKKKLFDTIGIDTNVQCTVGAVHLIRSALIANDIIKNLDLDIKKINTVKVLQTTGFKNFYMPNSVLQSTMETACSVLGIENYLQNNITDPFITALCDIASFYASTEVTGKQVKKLVTYDKNTKRLEVGKESLQIDSFKDIADEIHSVMDQSSSLSKRAKIEFLKSVEDILMQNYPEEFSTDPTKTPTSISHVHLLRNVISRAINALNNKETMIDHDVSLYNFNNGVMFNSIDMVGVKTASDIRTLVEQGNSKITDRYNKYQTAMRGHVEKYYESVGYTGIKRYGGGKTTEIYSRLFRKDAQNKLLNGDLILRNPWDPKEDLSERDRSFLKFILFTLNKYKYDWKSIDQMKESSLMEIDYYFPLCRKDNFLDKLTDENGNFNLPTFRALIEDSVNKTADIVANSDRSVEEHRSAAETLSEVYNEHKSRVDKDVRAELLSTYGVNAFMVDIHSALNIYVIAMESTNIYNEEVLPAVKSIYYAQMFDEIESGIVVSNTKEFTKKYLTSAIYGSPLYKGEVKQYMKIAAPILGVTSALALSWNLVNLPRELVMGMFTTISRAAFASYGQNTFGLKNYIRAWATMGWDMKDFIHSVTKIELLNEHFRISNMTISELPQQTTSTRTGLHQTFGRWMGWTLTAPDYFNRMTMFIAQMMEDGCWDAYSVVETENGPELKYDMSKDLRFEVLCRYGGDSDSVPAQFKSQYLQQLALYEIKRDELNESLDESDQITSPISRNNKDWYLKTAYTTKERNSLKSFSDSTFGYYDRDTKAWLYKTAIGVLFKQFMAYASSKKVQYFKTRTNQTDRGEYAQLTTNTGEKIWKIIVTNEQGKEVSLNVKDSELNTKYSSYKNDAKPVYVWKGTFVEGIVNSYWNLLTENIKAAKLYFVDGDLESKQKAKEIVKTLKEQYGKKGDIRHSNILQGLYDLWISIGLMWLIRLICFEDPEKYGESYKTQLKESSALFKLNYSILFQATSDFNIAVLLYNQVFEWKLPSLSILQNTGKSFLRALGDDDLTWYEGLGKGVVSSIGVFKPIRPFADAYFDEQKQN